jgi:adenosylcobinamide kinase/adenosylcobinamide-phosphate guanylyltransferase
MILVIGGSGSGKSEFAEKLITQIADNRGLELYYLATMKIYGEEDEKKIEKHRRMRAGKGFTTIEQAADICLAVNEMYPSGKADSGKKPAVLLECVSNLTANEMFKDSGSVAPEDAAEKILRDISALNKGCGELVIVSDDVFEDGMDYPYETKAYAAALGKINRHLAKLADEVFEVVAGIPVRVK